MERTLNRDKCDTELGEIESFISKVDAVNAAIRGMKVINQRQLQRIFSRDQGHFPGKELLVLCDAFLHGKHAMLRAYIMIRFLAHDTESHRSLTVLLF